MTDVAAPAKRVAWSISALDSFETCPKRYHHLRVLKDVQDTKGESAIWGSWVHKQLENRALYGTPLPVSIAGYEKLVRPILDAPGEKLVEKQYAINDKFQPVDWFSKEAWCRCVVDLGLITKKLAVLFDWKTGKPKPDSAQLALSAAVAMCHHEEVHTVRTAFVWLKDDKTDSETYTRDDAAGIWQSFMPRVQRLERAYSSSAFPPKPSGLCRKHCPIPKHKCEFSGKD